MRVTVTPPRGDDKGRLDRLPFQPQRTQRKTQENDKNNNVHTETQRRREKQHKKEDPDPLLPFMHRRRDSFGTGIACSFFLFEVFSSLCVQRFCRCRFSPHSSRNNVASRPFNRHEVVCLLVVPDHGSAGCRRLGRRLAAMGRARRPQHGLRPKHLPETFNPGKVVSGEVDLSTARNVKWAARLGAGTYGTPVVAGGKVFIGTNNGRRATRGPGRPRRADVLRRGHRQVPLATRHAQAQRHRHVLGRLRPTRHLLHPHRRRRPPVRRHQRLRTALPGRQRPGQRQRRALHGRTPLPRHGQPRKVRHAADAQGRAHDLHQPRLGRPADARRELPPAAADRRGHRVGLRHARRGGHVGPGRGRLLSRWSPPSTSTSAHPTAWTSPTRSCPARTPPACW